MDVKEWEDQLHGEGYGVTYIWQDSPNVFYPDHTHSNDTAHVILEGEMTVTSEGRTQTLKPGQRFDVRAHTVHSAQMGTQGCRYLIGEK